MYAAHNTLPAKLQSAMPYIPQTRPQKELVPLRLESSQNKRARATDGKGQPLTELHITIMLTPAEWLTTEFNATPPHINAQAFARLCEMNYKRRRLPPFLKNFCRA